MRKFYCAAVAVLPLAILAASSSGNERPPAQPTSVRFPEAPTGGSPNLLREPTVTVFDHQEVQGILGKEVRSAANENMGRIVDVIVDQSGQVRAAIIDFGGFLGVGNRKVAVAWDALRFPPNSDKVDHIVLELTRDQVLAAPEYKADKPVVVVGASGDFRSIPFP